MLNQSIGPILPSNYLQLCSFYYSPCNFSFNTLLYCSASSFSSNWVVVSLFAPTVLSSSFLSISINFEVSSLLGSAWMGILKVEGMWTAEVIFKEHFCLRATSFFRMTFLAFFTL